MSEAIVVSTHIAKAFIARHKPQNVTTMWLTDGEGFSSGLTGENGYYNSGKYIGKIAGGKQITITNFNHRHITPVLFDTISIALDVVLSFILNLSSSGKLL